MTKAVETDFLVLTARPGSDVLNDKKLAELADAIPTLPAADRLGADAVQYAIAPDLTGIADALTDRFGQEPFDVNRVSDSARQKKMLIADLESTIIEQECLDELADRLNLRDKISDITSRAMRGEIEFEPALRERVALLAGLPATSLQDVHDDVTLMPGAATLLATLKQHNVFCGLVSGGFSFFADKIADLLNFDACHCNQLEIEDAHLTGRVIDPILGREAKAARLKNWCNEKDLPVSETLAVGDGSNDLDMLKLSGMGVAFRAKPLVADAATFRIDYGDLTALLYLQGYQANHILFKS